MSGTCGFPLKNGFGRSILVAKWLGFQAFTDVAQIQSLVSDGDPISCKPKNKKKRERLWH